ncbi:MAG: ABC transporter substrate-binding protein [Thermobacillus sp.]|uniref:ABC transporter substrate-binding protein n=1 Tax=Thermobacillus sp. TaxID=2108467 RepID=UPI000E3A9E75|nr:ABC transporter substrate-binding protein [Thermobacillus sp.]REK58319.1 MAG: ABC transporter substrate-binding protein [Thermobacillus sp.]
MLRSKKDGKRTVGMLAALLLVLALALAACGGNNNAGENSGANSNGGAAAGSNGAAGETNGGAAESGADQGEAAAPQERTLTDALGNEVTIPANPQRIIASYLEDHLLTLGVVPVAQWSVPNGVQDYLQPAGLEGVPTISYNLPPEEVASFNPDLLIIGSESLVQNDLYSQYSKIAPTFVLGDQIANDWRAALSKIGEVLGKEEEAKAALEAYDQKVQETKAKLEGKLEGKSIAILWLTAKQFYMVDTKTASGAVVFGDLGVNPPNVYTEIPEENRASWNPISLEKLSELTADYIFLVNYEEGQTDSLIESDLWKTIPAVKAGHVYEMDKNRSWLYSGAIAGQLVLEDIERVLGE